MAILGKIRQRSLFLIIIIALALFSFVLADVIRNGGFLGSNQNVVGTIDGTKVNAQQFMQKVGNLEQQNKNITNTQAINNVWQQEVKTILLNKQVENLGLGLADEEVITEIKNNPYFSQNPQFLNEAGTFDEAKFKEWVRAIKNDPNPTRWNNWKDFENTVEETAIQQLYNNMIKGGTYTTKIEGQFKYITATEKATFDYVTVPYSTINNDEVKISDNEISAYLKKHPKKYKSESTRNISYVLFENKPSEADKKEMEKKINTIVYGTVEYNKDTETNDTIPSFADRKDVIEFVNQNSDIKFDSTYLIKTDLPLEYQEQLFNLDVNEVFGPYVHNESQCVSKMLDKKANGSVKVSHILLAHKDAERSTATRTKEEAKKLADELMAKIKKDASTFGSLAKEYSDDPGSKNNNGEYDNVTPKQMVPEFDTFIFNNPIGSLGVVETDFGFHVIKVLNQYPSVLLATIAQKIEPSEETIDNIYTKASQFEAEANEKPFNEVVEAKKLVSFPVTNLQPMGETVTGLGTNRAIVRWAFQDGTNVNTIKRFETEKGYVVAVVTAKNETGLLDIETARVSVEKILQNQKKAAIIKQKMTATTLEEVAKATGGSVKIASNITPNNPSIPTIGKEPEVVGRAFSLEANKTSQPIEGNTGVFIIRTKTITPAPKLPTYKSYATTENTQQKNASQGRAFQAIKENAEIEDNRKRY